MNKIRKQYAVNPDVDIRWNVQMRSNLLLNMTFSISFPSKQRHTGAEIACWTGDRCAAEAGKTQMNTERSPEWSTSQAANTEDGCFFSAYGWRFLVPYWCNQINNAPRQQHNDLEKTLSQMFHWNFGFSSFSSWCSCNQSFNNAENLIINDYLGVFNRPFTERNLKSMHWPCRRCCNQRIKAMQDVFTFNGF